MVVVDLASMFGVEAMLVALIWPPKVRSWALDIPTSPEIEFGLTESSLTSTVVVSTYGSVSRLIVTTWGTNLPLGTLAFFRDVVAKGFPAL